MAKHWDKVLFDWDHGRLLKIPRELRQPYFWRTSPIVRGGNSLFYQEYVPTSELPTKNNFGTFVNAPILLKDPGRQKHAAIVAPNLSGDTIMVIPTLNVGTNRRTGKKEFVNYSSLYYFNKYAPKEKKIAFWKTVSRVIKKQLRVWKKVWVSTHGLGVGYLHVRISNSPKYYGNSPLASL